MYFMVHRIYLAGCFSPGGERIVNEMVFDLNNISDLEIAYDEENVTFCDGRSEKIGNQGVHDRRQSPLLCEY